MVNDSALDDLRREIDAVDDQLHEQLIRRTEIVGRVGAVKRRSGAGTLALRPGREAAILRRLAARHTGAFPLAALLRMWRELLSGQVSVQGGLSLSLFAPTPDYRDAARDHFGSAARICTRGSPEQVVSDVAGGAASVGVAPVPDGGAAGDWWRLLCETPGAPRIIAELPFWRSDARPRAWALANLADEATGDDVTVAVIELGGAGEDAARRALETAGLTGQVLAVRRADAGMQCLTAMDGFASDAELAALGAARAVGGVHVVGRFARPLSLPRS